MTWENNTLEQQRLQLVTAYINGLDTMTNLCKLYKVSRKTGYKWHKRFLELGEAGLFDSSRAPHNPRRIFTDEHIEQAVDLKLKYRTWGPKKILAKLSKEYPEVSWPCPTRLYEIFKDLHLVTSRRLKKRVPATAPLSDITDCNKTWAVDFKGWFLTEDGSKCEPLTLTDSFSRYLIRCECLKKHSAEYVWPIFAEAFREYGLPEKVRSDNGSPFATVGAGRLSRLSINLIKAGVIPEWITPGCPEENGRHERFHLTLKQSVASPPQKNMKLQIQSMKDFQYEYNFERPHEALGMDTPASCYQPSSRRWDGVLRAPEYDTKEFQVRKVCPSGCIWLNQQEHYIGKTLKGEYVGIKQSEEPYKEIYYGPVYLGKIDHEVGLKKPKRIMRKRKQR